MPIAMGVTGGLFVIFAGHLAILHSQQLEQFGTTRRGKLAARVMDWPIWAIRRVLFGEVSDLVITAKAFRVFGWAAAGLGFLQILNQLVSFAGG